MPNKKNIEFIDKNIEKCKELMNDIENTSDELKMLMGEEEIIKARTEMKEHVIEQLKQFKEIKSILEAWYIVKPYIEIIDKNTPSPYWNTKPMYDECKLKDTNILIKALEVQDER